MDSFQVLLTTLINNPTASLTIFGGFSFLLGGVLVSSLIMLFLPKFLPGSEAVKEVEKTLHNKSLVGVVASAVALVTIPCFWLWFENYAKPKHRALEILKEEAGKEKARKNNQIGLAHRIFANLDDSNIDVGEYKDKAEEIYRAGAKSGIAWAVGDLGHYLYNHSGNPDEALVLLKEANEKGVTRALLTIGFIYERDKGDYPTAFNYYKEAAAKGLAMGKNNVAMFLYQNNVPFEGTAEEKNELIKRYLTEASDLGEAKAKVNLSKLYRHGILFEQDMEKADHLMEDAAEMGNIEAMFSMAEVERLGYGKRKRNTDAAMKYYNRVISYPMTRNNREWILKSAEKILLLEHERGSAR